MKSLKGKKVGQKMSNRENKLLNNRKWTLYEGHERLLGKNNTRDESLRL